MRLADWTGRPVSGPTVTGPGPAGPDPAGPDGWPGLVPIGPGDLDADGDGVPDTVVAARDTGGAWVFTDTDADGFADRVLDLGPPGSGWLDGLF